MTFEPLQGMTALAHVEQRLEEGGRGRGQHNLAQEHTAIRDMLRRERGGGGCAGWRVEEGAGDAGRGPSRSTNRVKGVIEESWAP